MSFSTARFFSIIISQIEKREWQTHARIVLIGLIVCFALDNIDGIYKYFIPRHSHGSSDFDGGDPGVSGGGSLLS